jgi:hypothetical protein
MMVIFANNLQTNVGKGCIRRKPFTNQSTNNQPFANRMKMEEKEKF